MKPSKPRRNRPPSFILFAVWIAILGGLSLTWSIVRFQQMPTLLGLGFPTNWAVATLGLAWGMGLLAGAVGLLLRWEPARWAVLFLVPAYYLTQGLDWLLSVRAGYASGRIGLYIVFSLLVTAYNTWFLTWRRTREQFKNSTITG